MKNKAKPAPMLDFQDFKRAGRGWIPRVLAGWMLSLSTRKQNRKNMQSVSLSRDAAKE